MNLISLKNRVDRRARKFLNKGIRLFGGSPLAQRVPLYFIELTNKCNLRCPMCPRSDAMANRGLGHMDFDLYRHIIDSIVRHGARYVDLNRFGESLLYPRFIEAVEYAKGKGIRNIGVTSNATLLTREMAEAIVDVGLDRIKFSIDTLDPGDYAAGRVGAALADTLGNVDYFLSHKKRKGAARPAVTINSVLLHDNFDQIKKIYERFKGDCDVHFKPLAYYGESQDWKNIKRYEGYAKRPCIQPWERLNFFVNGDVNVCCGDVVGELIVGNVKDKSIAELWLKGRAVEIRRMHSRLDFDKLKVCLGCSGINADWYSDSIRQQKEIYGMIDPARYVVGLSNTTPIVE